MRNEHLLILAIFGMAAASLVGFLILMLAPGEEEEVVEQETIITVAWVDGEPLYQMSASQYLAFQNLYH